MPASTNFISSSYLTGIVNDDLADDSGRDGLMGRTLHRVAYDMGFADSDGE